MLRSRVYVSSFVILATTLVAILSAANARGGVYGLCVGLSGQLNGQLHGRNSAIVEQLSQQLGGNAGAQQAMDAVRNGVANGTLTGGELAALAKAVRTAAPAGQADINTAIAKLAVNQQVLMWLRNAPLGATNFPQGRNVPIALVPDITSLARGTIVPLGFGPVVITTDQPGDRVVLGWGDVAQVAAQVAGDEAAEVRVTLSNSANIPVNYTVNQSPYSMAPKFEQTLSGESSWIVAFDRGGGNGTAQYQLAEGQYEFALTPQGWDLYRKEARPAVPPNVGVPPNTGVASAGAPPAAGSAYAQESGIRLPPSLKLFDPVAPFTGASPGQATAQLSEQFSLFRSVAQTVTPQ